MGDERVGHRVVGADTRGGDHAPDRQPELDRELEVTLVVGRHGHDRARAVAGEHVVGDEDRDALAVDRVDRLGAEHHAGLLAVGREAVDLGPASRLQDVVAHLGVAIRVGQGLDQRVLGGEDHERGAVQRVGPRREDAQRVATGLVGVGRDREVDLGAFGAADPVRLLDADRLGPVDALEVEQLVGVRRGLEIPLVELALLDERAAAPAMTVGALDLLARQRPVVGAPVHRRLLAIGEALLQEAQEEPLVPVVVTRVGRDHLGLPGERRAHRPELATHVLDVRHRPGEWVPTAPDRGILGRQTEGIEADREEHVVAVHPAIAGERVAGRDDVPVPDMQVARRVRVHRQHVVLGLGVVEEVGLVLARLLPARLPARLDGCVVIAFDAVAPSGGVGHGASSSEYATPPAVGEG